MRRDLIIAPPHSHFLSCEKDFDIILRKLFVESKPYCNILKRLLVANVKECLDDDGEALKKVDNMSLPELYSKGYIRLVPKLAMEEHAEVKSYIIVGFDNFTQTSNDEFKDNIITFDILCHPDYWDLGGFRLRPLKIAGYIDGILNKSRLTGIGTLEFVGLNQLILNQELMGYSLMYRAVHGSDDEMR